MNINHLRQAVEIVGSQTELAKKIGVSQPRLWNWINRDDRVPAEYVRAISAATEGKVLPSDLRPDIFGPEPKAVGG